MEEIKNPFYKKWWFIGLIIFLIFGFILDSSKDRDTLTEENQIIVETTTNPPSTSTVHTVATTTVTNRPDTIKTGGIQKTENVEKKNENKFYNVVSVVDGDTLKIDKDGQIITLRLIGIDTPETLDPRKSVQCFGVEASTKAKEMLIGKKVRIEVDLSQGEFDKYSRTLAYIFLENGLFFNKYMIEQGFANEYTYNLAYKYQKEFKQAQQKASANKLGLWGDICQSKTPVTSNTIISSGPALIQADNSNSCTIKGNINDKGEKIYHTVGCSSYAKTKINESAGEKWFCNEQEAINSGWRKAQNCD